VRTEGDGAWARAAVLLLLLAVATVLALTVDLPPVADVRSWVEGAGPAGWIVMVLGLALVLLAPLPRSAVSVLIGVVVGFGPGVVLALFGAFLSALIAFGLSRALGRTAVTRLAGPRLARVDRLMADRGFAAVLAGRLFPLMPFVVLSYGAGLSATRLAPFALATGIGLVPSTIVQVGIGASAGVLAERSTAITAGIVVIAVVVPAAWVLLVRRNGRAPAAKIGAAAP
jgi:uncharacterized membrane protein YdjX (TVP38/TMEM64 family)